MTAVCGGELGWSPRTSIHEPFVLECRTCHGEAGYGNAAEALEAQARGCQQPGPCPECGHIRGHHTIECTVAYGPAVTPRGEDGTP